MPDIVIRKATERDASFLAWSILTATRSHLSRGWFDIAFARPEAECLEFLGRLTIAKTRSQWHYSGFWVAEREARPVCALFAARAADAYPSAPTAIRDALREMGWSPAERASFWDRGAYLFTCPSRPDDECLTIENVATIAECRGRGYMDALLARAFEDGRSDGLREAQTSCFIGNHAAERAYARVGFRFLGERQHPRFEATAGSPGLRRFAKSL
jgi:translation initiation factor 4G